MYLAFIFAPIQVTIVSMIDYESFFKPRRLGLARPMFNLSAGLSPRIFMSAMNKEEPWDLVTTTAQHYLMGGTYFWKHAGTMKSKITGSRIPYFKEGLKISMDTSYPVHDNLALSVHFTIKAFFISERQGALEFVENESLSQRYGLGLLDAGIGSIDACKIEIRDVTGDGLPDIILGENNWHDYHPSVIKGTTRKITHWNDSDYIPHDEHGKWRGGRLHGRVFVMVNLGENPADPETYKFAAPRPIENVDQYGFCTPVFGDFTANAREDMICGDFLNNLTYFKRIWTKPGDFPRFEKGIPLLAANKQPRKMHGVINYLIGSNITRGDRIDLLVGSENGYITLLENLGEQSDNGTPFFADDLWIQQENAPLKADVLAVP
nr:hypothetical protein [Candidatus Sigynarchaeota archaeon]